MRRITRREIVRFVEKNIESFHHRRLDSLKNLSLSDVLKRKNPYLFRAKNINTAGELIRTILDAHLSSQEEGLFGDFLEELAIFICSRVYGGRKSSAEGIDLEFRKQGGVYLVTIKSGPNWGNSQQIGRMKDNFRRAKRVLGTSRSRMNVVAVNGCCYGKDGNPNKGDYLKLCGQDFWTFISGDNDLYTDIIEPLGHKAKEKNDAFLEAYSTVVNKFTRNFMDQFCRLGKIDWKLIVKFNSGRSVRRKLSQTSF